MSLKVCAQRKLRRDQCKLVRTLHALVDSSTAVPFHCLSDVLPDIKCGLALVSAPREEANFFNRRSSFSGVVTGVSFDRRHCACSQGDGMDVDDGDRSGRERILYTSVSQRRVMNGPGCFREKKQSPVSRLRRPALIEEKHSL